MGVNYAECEAAGLDPKAVERLLRRMESVAKDAKAMGLTIFGGAGSGSFRFRDRSSDHRVGLLIVASVMNGSWDGGDGGDGCDCGDGLIRGEGC